MVVLATMPRTDACVNAIQQNVYQNLGACKVDITYIPILIPFPAIPRACSLSTPYHTCLGIFSVNMDI